MSFLLFLFLAPAAVLTDDLKKFICYQKNYEEKNLAFIVNKYRGNNPVKIVHTFRTCSNRTLADWEVESICNLRQAQVSIGEVYQVLGIKNSSISDTNTVYKHCLRPLSDKDKEYICRLKLIQYPFKKIVRLFEHNDSIEVGVVYRKCKDEDESQLSKFQIQEICGLKVSKVQLLTIQRFLPELNANDINHAYARC